MSLNSWSTPSVKPQKTAVLLAQRIVAEIAEKGLEPGVMLPPEREMQAQYEVARGTLREALRFLEIQGVLTIKSGPGGGPVVSSPDPRHLASMLALILHMSGAEYRTILEARQLVEPALAAQAASRVSEEDIEELRATLARMADSRQSNDAFLAENRVFHAVIARASGNQILEYMLSALSWISEQTAVGAEYSTRRRTAIVEEHRRVVEALAARDPEEAEYAMRAHMEDVAAYLERRHSQRLKTPLRWDQAVP